MDIQEILGNTMNMAQTASEQNLTATNASSEFRARQAAKFYEAWDEDAEAIRAEKAERIRKQSNLGLRFQGRTFETFDSTRNPDAYATCLSYADSYTNSERNFLLLTGAYGTGKTHLAAAIANRLMDNGVPVLFNTFGGHLNKLKLEFGNSKSNYLSMMQNIEMLMMDDIGKEQQTEWTRAITFEVINYRYEHKLPVVMTTNLQSRQLSEYLGGAVWSRLHEICQGVKTIGGDYRRES